MVDDPDSERQQAVVIGGSMAGLLAARVLCDHFSRVVLIDRDVFPGEPAFRNGVPQSRHLHVLLVKGRQILEHYFPGLMESLVTAGAVPVDVGSEFLTISIFGPVARSPADLTMLLCSRNLLEWQVRMRLLDFPNLRVLTRAEVTGLQAQNGQVTGVRLRGRGGADLPEALSASLVVDCSGRGSELPGWLSNLGYPAPEMNVVNSHLGYATRWYRQAEQPIPSWEGAKAALVWTRPPDNPRGGGILPVEGGLWIATLAGTAHCYPPTDEEGFLEFARLLPDPLLFDAIARAEPVSPIYGYRRTENQWRRYDRLERWPGGLVVMGDAVCCFNPVYGQGMTAAALAASLLDEALEGWETALSPAFGHTFQRKLAKKLETPWLMATREDFRWKETEGERPGRLAALLQAYMDRVIRLACRDPQAGQAFLRVVQLLEPPQSLFHPGILFPALTER